MKPPEKATTTQTGSRLPDHYAWSAARSTTRRRFPPGRLARAVKATLAELLDRLLPQRRRRSNPRVIKQKMSNWPLKRAPHRHPNTAPEATITIVAATKTHRQKRPKRT